MYLPNRPSRAIFLRLALTLAVCCLGLAAWSAQARWSGAHASPALAGTKTVCPSGCDYASITAAIADIQAQGLNGALVLVLAPSYTSAGETFPLNFTNLTGASATNTITVRPASGATNLAITSANVTATISLNNANFVTIDGRPGGAGTAKELTIGNTNTSGAAIQFINEASNNTVKYVTLNGVTTNFANGVVFFSTTTGANGNDNNTLDHCDIRDGASMPIYAVFSAGTTTTTVQNNSGNTLSNCNIFNFLGVGVLLGSGNTDWTITGNSFYQTASRTGVDNRGPSAISISRSGNNFTVTNNFIGGSAPNAGGAPWTITGTAVRYNFYGINLSVGATTPSNVQGNTIANFSWLSAQTISEIWTGIRVLSGKVNLTGNTIGSGTGTDSVVVTNTTNAFFPSTTGIILTTPDSVTVSNNTIGSIKAQSSSTSLVQYLVGIYFDTLSGTYTITGNTIGSTTTANSLNAATASTSTSPGQLVAGIYGTAASATITGNTVANLNNNNVSNSAGGLTRGIKTLTSGVYNITGNTVRNLSDSSKNTETEASACLVGIEQASSASGQTVSQNTIHTLTLTDTGSGMAPKLAGLLISAGGNTVARNLIYGLSASRSGPIISGIQVSSGASTFQNNLVRLGLDAAGNSVTNIIQFVGLYESNSSAGNNNFYFNSVFVGGTGATAGSTYALRSLSSQTRNYQNNILYNGRSGFSTDYAVGISNTGGLTSNNNIFFANGTGGVLGFSGSDRATIQAWRCATGQDGLSAFVDPLFVAPTAVTPDLHLQASNPAEGAGAAIAGVTDDFDGQTRSSLTPTDIGADAGNFTSSSDVFAPSISYTLLTSGSTDNRILTGFATITDNVSVAGGVRLPRLYFKKSTDADVFGGNTSTDNGWKYVTASNTSSPYSFTIDYSIINGGSVANGETIQYFVVAQDAANNLSSNPVGATASAAPPVQNINAKPCAGVKSYTINDTTLSGGVKTVCASGCDYTNLTGASGIFATINGAVVTGSLVINIVGDLTENGTNGLNQLKANNFPVTVTIRPADSTIKTISGNVSVTNGMIRLNGADDVTIDGRFNNAGRFLTFRNTNTSTPTITLLNDASNNIIRNSVIEGSTLSNGVVFIGVGTTTGNDNNLITDNQVRDRSDAAGVPGNLILSQAGSAPTGILNSGNAISNNELFNFAQAGITISTTNLGKNESWTISGNTIYQTAARTSFLTGIQFSSSDGTNTVTGNTIHDLDSGSGVTGISLASVVNVTVERNRIYSFPSGNQLIGIQYNGSNNSSATVANNQVTIIPASTGDPQIYGIRETGSGTNRTFNAYYNSVLIGGTASGTNSTWACLRNTTAAAAHTSRNNICFNNRTGGTGNHFAAGNQGTIGTYSSDYNLFIGIGAVTATNFMDYGTTPVSFASWKTSTGGDANSSAGNPGGNFTTAMFVNPAMGDLHIVGAGNPLVSNTGTPVSSITTDYDNETRHATTPDIGSDEFTPANVAPTFTACPMSQSVNTDPGQCTASVAFTVTASGPPAPTVTCKIGSTTIMSGYNFPLGISSVVCTATNGTTPDAICSFSVTVIDNQNRRLPRPPP